MLGGLDYIQGAKSDSLKKLEGTVVRIPGFVVPLDDFQEQGSEFLLVPYYGACVHTPPPPPNQIVFVRMSANKNVSLSLFEAVWMEGKRGRARTKYMHPLTFSELAEHFDRARAVERGTIPTIYFSDDRAGRLVGDKRPAADDLGGRHRTKVLLTISR